MGRRPLFDLMTDPSRYPRAGGGPGAPQPPAPAPGEPVRLAPSAAARPMAASSLEAKPGAPRPAAGPTPGATTAPTPAQRSAQAPAPIAAAPAGESSSNGRPGVTVPLAWVYWIATGAVVLFAVIWWGGFMAGNKDAARRYGRELSPPAGGVDPEPVRPAAPPEPGPEVVPPAPEKQSPAPTTGDLFGSGGWTDADPRQKGMNYLRLATLSKADAVRVVEYLTGKGKQALAVPSRTVERGPDGGKNPGSYFVYLLTPLSRDQYRDGKTAVRIENEIKAIGREWAKQKDRGPTDFASPGWVKFD